MPVQGLCVRRGCEGGPVLGSPFVPRQRLGTASPPVIIVGGEGGVRYRASVYNNEMEAGKEML